MASPEQEREIEKLMKLTAYLAAAAGVFLFFGALSVGGKPRNFVFMIICFLLCGLSLLAAILCGVSLSKKVKSAGGWKNISSNKTRKEIEKARKKI